MAGGLGLQQYEQAFRANDIDGEVLPRLTAEDLVGLGVVSVGHRRRLLDAIAALHDGTHRRRTSDPPRPKPTRPWLSPSRDSPRASGGR